MGPVSVIMVTVLLTPEPANHRRIITTLVLAALAVCAVVVVVPGDAENAQEEMLLSNNPMLVGSQNLQLAQQLQKYDAAIHKVDQGIATSKSQLVSQSHKLGQATKFAMAMHAKLMRDQQMLITEKARTLLSPSYSPSTAEMQMVAPSSPMGNSNIS